MRVSGAESAVEIAVENGGPPIRDVDRALLFDPFRRGRASQEAKGLGLGLFIVQQIACAHGGDVQLESGNDRTVFVARLQR